MRITLFLQNKIEEFCLPEQISGSYSFDENDDEETRLINLEAREGIWVLYTIDDVAIIENNQVISECPLQANQFYILRRNTTNKNYLMYVQKSFDPNFALYSMDKW